MSHHVRNMACFSLFTTLWSTLLDTTHALAASAQCKAQLIRVAAVNKVVKEHLRQASQSLYHSAGTGLLHCCAACMSYADMSVPPGLSLELTTVSNLDRVQGLVAPVRLCSLNLFDHVHALNDLPKHHVLAIQVPTWNCADEELAAIGAGSCRQLQYSGTRPD